MCARKVPGLSLSGRFSWEINTRALWELAACGVAIFIGIFLFFLCKDTTIFILGAFSGYIGARILIWLYNGGFR